MDANNDFTAFPLLFMYQTLQFLCYHLDQGSPTFWALGTSFMEGFFSADLGWDGMWFVPCLGLVHAQMGLHSFAWPSSWQAADWCYSAAQRLGTPDLDG